MTSAVPTSEGRAMTEPPVHLLEALASFEEQRRYIVGASTSEYLLPEEIVNDAWHFCERVERQEIYFSLTEEQREAVARLKEAIKADGECLERCWSSEHLIEIDPAWARLRQSARDALNAFGGAVPD